MNEYIYEYDDFGLTKDGVLRRISTGEQLEWYKNSQTQKPWVPGKRKTFVSLIKQMIRDKGI